MDIADLTRRLENMIRLGTIAQVDHAKARCRVTTGGITTGWLPWVTRRAGSTSDWDPVSANEQCIVFCPSGDPSVGIVLAGIYSEANPAKSSAPALHRVEWDNGDYVEHDAETGAYTLKVSGHVSIQAASLSIQCSGAVSINGSRIDLN